jgi:Uma2 family endonuclease
MITHDRHAHYTIDDFKRIPEGTLVQLIGGRLVYEPAPTPYHQRISMTIAYKLVEHVHKHRLGIVIASPIDVYFSELDAYQPDIIFIAAEREKIIREKMVEGAPDMVTEILSPSNTRSDLKRKQEIYERSGVREYWIVDPKKKIVDCFTNVGGRFRRDARVDIDGVVRSSVIEGFKVEGSTIFNPY